MSRASCAFGLGAPLGRRIVAERRRQDARLLGEGVVVGVARPIEQARTSWSERPSTSRASQSIASPPPSHDLPQQPLESPPASRSFAGSA